MNKKNLVSSLVPALFATGLIGTMLVAGGCSADKSDEIRKDSGIVGHAPGAADPAATAKIPDDVKGKMSNSGVPGATK